MKNYHATHPLVAARIPQEQAALLTEVLEMYGLTFRDFVLESAREWRSRRVPESQGGLKIVLGGREMYLEREDIEAMIAACNIESDRLMRFAEQTTDPDARRARRQQAAPYLNAQHVLEQFIEAWRHRSHVIQSGIRQARHRYRAQSTPEVTGALALAAQAGQRARQASKASGQGDAATLA